MARSPQNSSLAFPSEVARYLCLEDEDINRMMAMDALPYLLVPKIKRSVRRIPLRDFHAWLLKRVKNPAPAISKFETFLADFHATRRPLSETTSAKP